MAEVVGRNLRAWTVKTEMILSPHLFIYFWLLLGLRCHVGLSSSWGEQGQVSSCSARASHLLCVERRP